MLVPEGVPMTSERLAAMNAALFAQFDHEDERSALRAEPGYSGANVAGLMYLEDELLKARRELSEVRASHAKLEQAMRDAAATLHVALYMLGPKPVVRAEKVIKDALEDK